MRVEANGGLPITADLASGKRTEANSSAIGAGQGQPEDQATISPQHKQILNLVARVTSAPDIRQEKVAALSLAIRNGNYQVSADQTAGALLEQMRRRA